jgi:murein DD-endopeptidase MepM/ murein hydrolase activator NlpD
VGQNIVKVSFAATFSLWVAIPFMSLITPAVAQASLASFVSGIFKTAQASTTGDDNPTETQNSQTMSLLEAPQNVDPTATTTKDATILGGDALVSNAGPSGDPTADTINVPSSSQISLYVVKPGDTLSEIAQMFDVSTNTILLFNDIKKNTALTPGQVIKILPISSIAHVVVKGDTLQKLADTYNADANDIIQYNNLADDSLTVGDTILIPDAEAPSIDSSGDSQTSSQSTSKTTTKTSTKSTSKTPVTTKKTTTKASSGGSTADLAILEAGPFNGPDYDSYYAMPTVGICTQGLHSHNAVDIGGKYGTPIKAAAAGTVIIATDHGYNGGYGEMVAISHANGTQTLYAHMSAVKVAEGQTVSQDQVIGSMGNTGEVSGPTGVHLHFEVRGAHNPFCTNL